MSRRFDPCVPLLARNIGTNSVTSAESFGSVPLVGRLALLAPIEAVQSPPAALRYIPTRSPLNLRAGALHYGDEPILQTLGSAEIVTAQHPRSIVGDPIGADLSATGGARDFVAVWAIAADSVLISTD